MKIVFFFIILLLKSTSVAWSIGISTLRPIAELQPGQNGIGKISLSNENTLPTTVRIEIKKDPNSESGLVDWIKLKSENLYIEPKSTQLLEIQVELPEDAVGEYSARLVYLENIQSEEQSAINLSISTPFYVRAKGTELFKCAIENFKLKNAEDGQLNLDIKNLGNVHLRPVGNATVYSINRVKRKTTRHTRHYPRSIVHFRNKQMLGNPVKIDLDSSPIYPNQSRTVDLKVSKPLSPGRYLIEINLSLFENSSHSLYESFIFYAD